MVIQNFDRPAVLRMGRGPVGNWLEVDLEGNESNCDAPGAGATSHVGGRARAR